MSKLELIQRIDRLCIGFEDDLLNSKSPKMEEYLARVPEDARKELLQELLLVELNYADKAASSLDSYTRRFPEHSEAICEIFERERPTVVRNGSTIQRIGRYEVLRRIGSGGFGLVFEGFDADLKRSVAIKVPRKKWLGDDGLLEAALGEAQILAALSHPNILPVYDAGKCDEFGFFLVTGLVDGKSLGDFAKSGNVGRARIIAIITSIAKALESAHEQGVVHRDIKPSNIMIDQNGTPFLLDFGLAMDDDSWGTGPGFVGTPRYMSPEQSRGESHRVDRTTDIYSLGVVLTELVSPPKPTATGPNAETCLATATPERPHAKPQFEPSPDLPDELRRICLRATAQRAADRYQSAGEFYRDLESFCERDDQEEPVRQVTLVPRGLRSFESADAKFFRELLPGPCDAQGTPDLVARLVERIDNSLTTSPSPVITVIGPSGSGKSSLVKAGVLPFLPRRVATVCIDASLPNPERQLAVGIDGIATAKPHGTLPEVLAQTRDGGVVARGEKLLVVIDQFESWLASNPGLEASELVAAMRHCDGRRCQFVLIVRDDFFTSHSRLMQHLELPLAEGTNSFATIPFDVAHTKRVLEAYGRAYGRFDGSNEQVEFVSSVAEQLIAEDIGTVPVRLTALAETLREANWTQATLDELGGVDGVATRYLKTRMDRIHNETTAAKHPDAIRHLLHQLLPSVAQESTLPSKTASELKQTCAWTGTDSDFASLLGQLELDLQLISSSDDTTADRSYQLAHSFLVRPLRDRLQQNKMETVRGRAELRLEDRVRLWSRAKDSESLPGSLEYISFRVLTSRKDWDASTATMMGATRKHLAPRWAWIAGGVASLCLLAAFYGLSLRAENSRLRKEKLRSDLQSVLTSSPHWARDATDRFFANTTKQERQELVAGVQPENALAKLRVKQLQARDGDVDVLSLVESTMQLSEEQFALTANEIHSDEFGSIVAALKRHAKSKEIREALTARFEATTNQDNKKYNRVERSRRQTRLAILGMHLGQPSLIERVCSRTAEPGINEQFINQSRFFRDDFGVILDLIESTDRTDLRALMISSLAVYPENHVTVELRDRAVTILNRVVEQHTHVAATAAAVKTLERWGEPAPHATIAKATECQVNAAGMTMVRCDSLLPAQTVQINRQDGYLWVGQTEVTNKQFVQFMDSEGEQPEAWQEQIAELQKLGSSQPNIPFEYASLIDAMLYCNWLSQRCELDQVYSVPSQTEVGSIRINNANNGYRLPTHEEWRQVSKVCATFAKPMVFFATSSENSKNGTLKAVRRKLPNPNGLFDTYGSVREWTVRPRSPWKYSELKFAQLWGGSYNATRSAYRVPVDFRLDQGNEKDKLGRDGRKKNLRDTLNRSVGSGFRVVRNGSIAESEPAE